MDVQDEAKFSAEIIKGGLPHMDACGRVAQVSVVPRRQRSNFGSLLNILMLSNTGAGGLQLCYSCELETDTKTQQE